MNHEKVFYNNNIKSFFKNNDIEKYSTFNEGKPFVAERFIKTLKNKIYKHMTTIGKNIYFNDLDDIVDKYNNTVDKCNNTVHNSIKVKPKDVKNDNLTEYIEEFNKKDPKFKIGDHVRISKYKNIFSKGYLPNWLEEILVINKVKNTVPWIYSINDLNSTEMKGSFYEKELQKTVIRKNLE